MEVRICLKGMELGLLRDVTQGVAEWGVPALGLDLSGIVFVPVAGKGFHTDKGLPATP